MAARMTFRLKEQGRRTPLIVGGEADGFGDGDGDGLTALPAREPVRSAGLRRVADVEGRKHGLDVLKDLNALWMISGNPPEILLA